ncbi:uridine kinase [Micrococcus lylae]|nr:MULTISPECIES: uridylate kinase [Micrococcus]MCT2007608.1 uridine kinase [Micrococcus lylae]MCT2071361.1 uridine kinase [Micrococcus lylae]OFR90392.1 uridylate kinase [Micrococcus sp. HMSC067E09]WIK81850.1 uridine kinase [Micrococcus lylae]
MIREVVHRIVALPRTAPVRVAVDGRTASGKTTFADELAAGIQQTGRSVIRAQIDRFHRPKVERYRRGRMSAEGYYLDARDLDAVVSLLLAPLAPDGDRMIRTESFDLDADQPIDAEPWKAAPDAVLIVDGTFLQRPELAAHWDATIYVRTSPAVCLQRGIDRDSAHLGGPEQTQRMYAERYQPAYELYEQEASPEASADLIIDNDDPAQPTVHARPNGRLPRVER